LRFRAPDFSRLSCAISSLKISFPALDQHFSNNGEGSAAGFLSSIQNKLNSILISAQFEFKLWS